MKKTLAIAMLTLCLALTACTSASSGDSELIGKIDALQSSVDTLQTTLEEMQESSTESSAPADQETSSAPAESSDTGAAVMGAKSG